MKVRARVFPGYEVGVFGLNETVWSTRGGDRSSFYGVARQSAAVGENRNKPSWLIKFDYLDLRRDMMVVTGGRHSILKWLVADDYGRSPSIHACKPLIGIQRRGFRENKICLFLTGRGDQTPPWPDQIEYTPLVPYLQQGYIPWEGNELAAIFNPRQLCSALAVMWKLDMNEALGSKSSYD